MSWYGEHPKISKEVAKAHLPPSACKMCVYRERVQLKLPPGYKCPRCGCSREKQGAK